MVSISDRQNPTLLDLTRHNPTSFKAHAVAKVNLYLHIVGKRPEDGYHLLESLMAFADVGDYVSVTLAKNMHLDITGPFSRQLCQDGGVMHNLVMKVAKMLRQKQDPLGIQKGAHVTLAKNLPIGAGLGGGSSDAAVTDMLLSRLWGVEGLSDEELLSLGADIPICALQKAAMVYGIGERIEPVSLPGKLHVLLVYPDIALSAVSVYKRSVAYFTSPQEPVTLPSKASEFVDWLAEKRNDLEEPALALVPEIGVVLDVLQNTTGCKLARMSGSGTTCFGIYANRKAVEKAAEQVRTAYPDWWVQEAVIV